MVFIVTTGETILASSGDTALTSYNAQDGPHPIPLLTKNYPVQNVSGAEVEKPWSTLWKTCADLFFR